MEGWHVPRLLMLRVQRHLSMLWWPLEIARYKKWCFERKYASNLTCCGESNKTKYSVPFSNSVCEYACDNMKWKETLFRKVVHARGNGSLREKYWQRVAWHTCFFSVFVRVCTSFVMITLSVSPGGQATPLNLRVSARPRSPECTACSWARERAAGAPISYSTEATRIHNNARQQT